MCGPINPQLTYIINQFAIIQSFQIPILDFEIDVIFNIQPQIETNQDDQRKPTKTEAQIFQCLLDLSNQDFDFNNALIKLRGINPTLKLEHTADITASCPGSIPENPACIVYENVNGDAVHPSNQVPTIYYNRVNIDRIAESYSNSTFTANPGAVFAEIMIHEIFHPYLGAGGDHSNPNIPQPGNPEHYFNTWIGQQTAEAYKNIFTPPGPLPPGIEPADAPGLEQWLPPLIRINEQCLSPILSQQFSITEQASVRSARTAKENLPSYTIEWIEGPNPNI